MGRRALLRLGTIATAMTGASAVSTLQSASASAAIGDLTSPPGYVPLTEKGAPLGVATLDGKSKVPAAMLPDLSGIYGRASAAEVYAANFGTIGDGQADDTNALRVALTSAAGKTLVVTQMHRITGSLAPSTLEPTNIVFRPGAGLIVDSDVVAIMHQGSAGAAIAVTGGSAAGSTTLTVADASVFTAGGYLVLKSADMLTDPARTTYRGMLARVTEKSGNILTLDNPVYRDMPTRPEVVPVILAPRVTVDGGDFSHTKPVGPTGFRSALLYFALALHPTVRGIDAHDLGGPGVLVSHVDGGSFSGNLTDLTNDPDNGHFGYGVNVGGTTRYFRVISGTARRVRHGFTTGHGGGPSVVNSVGDPFRNHVSSDFLVTEGRDAGLDTHAQGWGNIIEPNVDCCRIGIQDRAQFTIFSGGIVSGSTLYGANISSEATGTLIDGTNFVNTPTKAGSVIRAAGTTGVLKDVYIPLPPNAVPTVSGGGQVEVRGSSFVPGYNFSRPGTFGLLGKRGMSVSANTDLKQLIVGLLGLPAGGATPLNLNGGSLTAGNVDLAESSGSLMLKSPDGTRYRITVANGGAVTAIKI
ncbi:hypothetical protein Achl_2935 [Pseudarthrobacter chlorophenolicus A6]|uniref:Pectate lyase superfamily protein domain-containing protein n=1 Tax=Pseudarthrobacter chlorophenolicus (strain ATCC 700700 / DSM 12829 / CIP 107037 / JCM 12360 / KCTC 9906 / NCIMB 13794 / A6) TaxID=452863 RepID=B8HEF2_PSECP|nr:hypothetical protein Achl_2935 [Pseudarthrobacter chlorophenolicus A6]SDQ73242.1 hypothetical protein SAMN04489738_2544 [Pseudarthrobacter chlorophenolicus]